MSLLLVNIKHVTWCVGFRCGPESVLTVLHISLAVTRSLRQDRKTELLSVRLTDCQIKLTVKPRHSPHPPLPLNMKTELRSEQNTDNVQSGYDFSGKCCALSDCSTLASFVCSGVSALPTIHPLPTPVELRVWVEPPASQD